MTFQELLPALGGGLGAFFIWLLGFACGRAEGADDLEELQRWEEYMDHWCRRVTDAIAADRQRLARFDALGEELSAQIGGLERRCDDLAAAIEALLLVTGEPVGNGPGRRTTLTTRRHLHERERNHRLPG
jgi:hypothetical protein